MLITNGVPTNFLGMFWYEDLKPAGVSVEQLFNPFTKELGLRYKKGTKIMCIIFEEKDSESILPQIWEFERDNFDIPSSLSKYSPEALKQ